MDWKDVKDYTTTGCGCLLIPLLLVVLPVYFGLKNKSKHEAEKRYKDSIENIKHIKFKDSVAEVLKFRDKITTVIVVEGDAYYHYYTDCRRLCLPDYDEGEFMLRSLAKERGLRVCPECRNLFFDYRYETDSDATPELFYEMREFEEEI